MSRYRARQEVIVIKETDQSQVDLLQKQLGISKILAKILVARNLVTYDTCKNYFRPQISHFHSPFLFKDMESAVKRIRIAITNREKIFIHGDYDVDGITATALLIRVLIQLGAICEYYLPNRLTEGYGISIDGIREIKRRQGTLLITADCGITADHEIAYAASMGIDVIITDHHEPQNILPRAFALLDPKIDGCTYPDKNLAGVGVALKLCQALDQAFGKDNSLWLPYLDLAALGTTADIVPLINENRVIVKLGFEQLSKTQNPGLKKLIERQKLSAKKISTSDVIYLLAPCINAAGRLGDSHRGAHLLLTDDEAEADLCAKELVEMNHERRALDNYVHRKAEKWVLNNVDLKNEFALVAGAKDWHVGVIGITASKLVERFSRPAFLFSLDDDGFAKGSGRSIKGLHLLEVLKECKESLISFGGHEAAAGATIKNDSLSTFRTKFNEVIKSRLSYEDLVSQVTVDSEIEVKDLTPKFYNIIRQMEPFGPGNRRPVFLSQGLKNRYKPRIVGKNHLKMTITNNNHLVMDAIAFNFGERLKELVAADDFSLAFTLDENTWEGKTNLQMKVKGMIL